MECEVTKGLWITLYEKVLKDSLKCLTGRIELNQNKNWEKYLNRSCKKDVQTLNCTIAIEKISS